MVDNQQQESGWLASIVVTLRNFAFHKITDHYLVDNRNVRSLTINNNESLLMNNDSMSKKHV